MVNGQCSVVIVGEGSSRKVAAVASLWRTRKAANSTRINPVIASRGATWRSTCGHPAKEVAPTTGVDCFVSRGRGSLAMTFCRQNPGWALDFASSLLRVSP
jgi:hypothetical protein